MNKARLFLFALLLANCCLAQLLVAQTPTTKVKRGYKIEYAKVLPNAMVGEIPIRVRVTRIPAVPSTDDELFNVSVNLSNGWQYDPSKTEFSTGLLLPAGKTFAEVELLAEIQDGYFSLVVERGNSHTQSRADDLLNEQIDSSRNMRTANGDATWLLISSKAPKSKLESRTYYTGQAVSYNSSYQTGSFDPMGYEKYFRDSKKIPGLNKIFQRPLADVLANSNWHTLQPAELPETWVGLSAVDYVLISHDEFKSLTQVSGYRKMLEQWVAAGGFLIVFNAENSLSHADSIFASLLGSERAMQPRQWAPVGSKRYGLSVQLQDSSPKPASELVAKDRCAYSRYLNGTVAVMVSPEKLPSWFGNRHFQTTTPIICQSTRVGRFREESAIPGVGKPPIALFGVFTGVFLFLIGPVILVIVTINNNRRFLFFFVPLFSFLTCVGILGYAIVADFNKQLGRTDTITMLDARSGFAYSKAYSAYYCGSQPSYYAYDRDTLVQTTIQDDSGFRIRELPEENRLSSPRIQPRKNHEVFTAKPYRTQQRFLVAESTTKPGVPEVTNQLGGRIKHASFKYQGKTYLVRDLEPKQSALGIEMSSEECSKEMRESISADMQTRGGSSLFRTGNSQAGQIVYAQNNVYQQRQENLRSFVAVLDLNPAIDPLIEPFDYQLQLHVVHGKY